MSSAKDVKFSLKVTMNNQKTKVLFAEADSDFTDVLISFLTMPLGRIVRVLKKHFGEEEAVRIGSLTTLYNGLANLDSVHFWTKGCKEALLDPMSSFRNECLKLKLDVSDTQPIDQFTCYHSCCIPTSTKVLRTSNYFDSATCICGKTMSRVAGWKDTQAANNDGVFTRKKASFIISDDLKIFPNTTGFIQTLSTLEITDKDVGEPINVTFGFNEFMDLLKGSLLSPTPLSDIILNKRKVELGTTTPKTEPGVLLHAMEKEATSANSNKMILKVMVQKSTNKLLFAQSEEDFIDFLCILLAIPIGGVECLLGGNACLKNIDNLYKSVANINGDKYLVTQDMKNRLVKPKLLHGYISGNPILPLSEESCPRYQNIIAQKAVWFSSVKFVKGQGKYIGGPTLYKITDDLTVTHFCMGSILSHLKDRKIPSSDVKELELEIGLQEVLSILKASLASTAALTNGLRINAVLMKQPKREQ
ncbi:PREDICTED: uncharacterized protein LOC105961715 [Erythranthe guttata]|uniref:uncharacterized protein LOC105961715 n=1 Tax=Erythranthe guttata TaxID=4155 RepID=UPI00064D888E|nr:PREDICTED: uncharacterized protein LOC105961715 [Erythranthe guttata]|eukprot:XP_012841425.1 PREDICTED: uncharacterized protein LOC105961715 [Erythranthe guttata]